MKNPFKLVYYWLFTSNEREWIPYTLMVFTCSVALSWWICCYMLNDRNLLWVDKIEAQDLYIESLINGLEYRIHTLEDLLHMHEEEWKPEPCCSVAEWELRRLDELEPSICEIITTADSTVRFPGLKTNIGDLFHEMCPE